MADISEDKITKLGERNNIKLKEITAMRISIDTPIEVLFDELFEHPGKRDPIKGDRTIGYFNGIYRVHENYHELNLKGTLDTGYRTQNVDIRSIKKINILERK